jgi:hypothetical protein
LLASLAKYDPLRVRGKQPRSHYSRGLASCSVTWPRSGIMRDGMCWELATLAPPTSETESGSWHTPRAHLEGWGGRPTYDQSTTAENALRSALRP